MRFNFVYAFIKMSYSLEIVSDADTLRYVFTRYLAVNGYLRQ